VTEEGMKSQAAVETMRRLIRSNQRLTITNICLTVAILILAGMMIMVMHQT
jgi:hypothetical protein